MKTAQVEINLYELNELTEEAKEKAIQDHEIFLCSVAEEGEEVNEEYTIESIELNEYLFFYSGELANVTHYCGKHPRAGEQVLTFHNKEYVL